jgi:hypothetical protein
MALRFSFGLKWSCHESKRQFGTVGEPVQSYELDRAGVDEVLDLAAIPLEVRCERMLLAPIELLLEISATVMELVCRGSAADCASLRHYFVVSLMRCRLGILILRTIAKFDLTELYGPFSVRGPFATK